MPAYKTISELLRTEPETGSFYRALEAAGLTDQLEKEGQLTVFAATDQVEHILPGFLPARPWLLWTLH